MAEFWTPTPSIPPPPPPGPVGPDPCAFAKVITQDDILALYHRILPPEYLAPLQDPGPGYELLQAYGLAAERVSRAIAHLECEAYILSASGARFSSGVVTLFRQSPAAGAITVKRGSVVTTSKGDRRFFILEDAVFGALATEVAAVPVVAFAPSWQWDLPGEVTTADGTVLPGEIDTVVTLDLDPVFGDTSIRVKQVLPTTGGQPAMLDALGADRGMPRSANEGDDPYRFRMRELPDTVSPDAMRRAIVRFFAPLGLSASFIELFDISFQTCWNAPSAVPPGSLFSPTLFMYNDPRPSPPFRDRWLGEDTHRGAFVVVVPKLPAVSEVGMLYNDLAENALDLTTSLGRRAVSAYNVPRTVTLLQGCYNGDDIGRQTYYGGLSNLLDQIKPAGAFVALELEGQ